VRRKGIEVTDGSRNQIRTHRFGRTDLVVSEYGLGCARIGGVFKNNPADFENLLTAALDGGITFFDTSDIYSQGESEKLLAKAFRGRRDRVVIASKAGYVLPSQRRMVARIKPLVRPLVRLLKISRQHLPGAVRGSLAQDYSPEYLPRAVEASLRRLRTDYLDLLQLHSPPAEIVRRGDWIAALESLRQHGKIRYYGVSCDTVEAAEAALAHAGVSALQLPLNLLDRSFTGVLMRAHAQSVGVIARECLANGLLVKELSATEIRTYCQSDDEASAKAAQIASTREQARAEGTSLQRLALQFVRDLDGVSVSLVGVSSQRQLNALLTGGLPPPRPTIGAHTPLS
jgi:aryl-alcohol dehydrogenase-like predicted oxidoreductase